MELPVKPGDMLAGRHSIESILGTCDMSVVVAARHAMLGQRVALKMFLPELAVNNLDRLPK